MIDRKGKLIVVSGPSGAGKSTVIARLMQRRQDVCFSVSATTRDPRPGEVNGVDYFFVTWDEFDRMIGDDELLEHAEYVGNCYGTPRAPVEKLLNDGFDVYLDIDVQGAMQVKALRPETLMIFLMFLNRRSRRANATGRSERNRTQKTGRENVIWKKWKKRSLPWRNRSLLSTGRPRSRRTRRMPNF